MAWILLSKYYLDTKGGGGLVIVGGSVDEVFFSLETDRVFVEGYIMREIFFGDYILLCFCLKLRVLLTVSVIFR